MHINKSPYSHLPKKQAQNIASTNLPLFANALNNPQKYPKKNKQNTDMHFQNLKLNKRKTNPGLEIDLECDEVLVPPAFEQDLTCKQELLFYPPSKKQRPSPLKNQTSGKNDKKYVVNRSRDEISQKQASVTPRQKKITQPVSIDLHCAEKIVNFDHMKTKKIEKIESEGNKEEEGENEKWKNLYYRMNEVLEWYQKQMIKKQERIQYLQARDKNRRI